MNPKQQKQLIKGYISATYLIDRSLIAVSTNEIEYLVGFSGYSADTLTTCVFCFMELVKVDSRYSTDPHLVSLRLVISVNI